MTPPGYAASPASVEGEGTGARRDADALASLAAEVRGVARSNMGCADQSERDAMLALADRAEQLLERLQALIDWADFALDDPAEFDSHGVRNLTGPVFDEAREAIAKAEGRSQGTTEQSALPREAVKPHSNTRSRK